MATRIPYDFATAGDTEEIPSVSSTDELSFQSGWTDAYEKDSTESGYRYISRSEHNYLWNVITSNIKEWQEQAFPDWISDELDSGTPYAYDTGAIVRYTDGLNYVSLVDSNTGEPSVSSDWEQFDASGLVKTTGDQSIAGVKTFTESPIVPTPTTDYQVATKEYVDGTSTVSASGYKIFPDGLIMQWASATSSSSGTQATYPIAFPNGVFSISLGDRGTSSGDVNAVSADPTESNSYVTLYSSVTSTVYYIALGY